MQHLQGERSQGAQSEKRSLSDLLNQPDHLDEKKSDRDKYKLIVQFVFASNDHRKTPSTNFP